MVDDFSIGSQVFIKNVDSIYQELLTLRPNYDYY